MNKFIILLLLFISACKEKELSKHTTDNPNFQVEFLFEHDGM